MNRPAEFRLESVLRVRRRERDECRQQLAEIGRAEDELRARLVGLLNEIQSLRVEQRAVLGPGTIALTDVLTQQQYEQALRRDVHRVREESQHLAEQFQRCREALLDADRRVQMLEKLRDQQQATAAAVVARREQTLLDESAAWQSRCRQE